MYAFGNYGIQAKKLLTFSVNLLLAGLSGVFVSVALVVEVARLCELL